MKGKSFSQGFFWLCGRGIPFLLCLILAIPPAAPLAGAQSTGGRIRGTVIDTTGGAVVGATVTLINEATHATRDVQANPTPFIRILSGNDTELGNSFDFEPVGEPNIVSPIRFLNPHTQATCAPIVCAPNQLFDPNSFADAPTGQFGNAPRTLCCGPRISQSDISIEKKTTSRSGLTQSSARSFLTREISSSAPTAISLMSVPLLVQFRRPGTRD